MPKCRVGLQKDCSTIFEGVWIPRRPRNRQPVVTLNNEQKDRIAKIISKMKCSKDFECYRKGFRNMCKTRISPPDNLVECSPENKMQCEFKFAF